MKFTDIWMKYFSFIIAISGKAYSRYANGNVAVMPTHLNSHVLYYKILQI